MIRKKENNKIKKHFHKGSLKEIYWIFVIYCIITIIAEFEDGKFDSINFIFVVIILIVIFLIAIKFNRRTISLQNDLIIYSGLFKNTKIKYAKIKKYSLMNESYENTKRYSLIIITDNTNWRICDIEQYRMCDILNLIDVIKFKSGAEEVEFERTITLDEIPWYELRT
jgi:hypothetical protein